MKKNTPPKYPLIRLLGKSIFILVFLGPLLFLATLSFMENWRFPRLLPLSWTLRHWQELLAASNQLLDSLFQSLALSLSVAFIATLAGFLSSFSLAYHPKRERLLLLAYFPYLLSPVVYAVCLNFYFVYLGLSGQWLGVFIAQLIITYPFVVILFSTFWNERMKNFGQAAQSLGANEWQCWVKVYFPMARNILAFCFFQSFLISWFEYGLTQLIGIGKVSTLTLVVFNLVKEANIYRAALAATLLFLPPLLLLGLNKRLLMGRYFF